MTIENARLYQRQGTYTDFQTVKREKFLFFDTVNKSIRYSPNGVEEWEIASGGGGGGTSVHNLLTGLQGNGTDYYHLNQGQFDKLSTFVSTGLSASQITSGVIDEARLPLIGSAIQVISSGYLSDLTAPQQATIKIGTIVATADGWRWVYSGFGSKTSSASYVQLGDINPEWVVIANKPTTLSGYGVTSADTLFDGKYLGNAIKLWTGTAVEYAAIVTKDPNTIYFVT